MLENLSSLGGAGAAGVFRVETALLGLLMAFVLGQLAAWFYIITHAGLSYSRAFVQSIVLLTVVVALAMMVIGNNIIIAFGLIGALGVIRFRNIIKDTRDMAFIFFALISGMASGTGRYALAVVGALVFCLILLYLHWVSFGSRHLGDGFLRFRVEGGGTDGGSVGAILNTYCRSVQLVSQRFHETEMGEMAYRLALRDPARAGDMVEQLRATGVLSNVSLVLHEEQAEV